MKMVDVTIRYQRKTTKTTLKPALDLLELCDVLSIERKYAHQLRVLSRGQVLESGYLLDNRTKLLVFVTEV
jgi:hypothetical protein